jgi:pimeloyl-ACP methyl ester carboxylesterase
MKSTHVVEHAQAEITYDVHRPELGGTPLLMVGQPMDASGFGALAALFPERTVITYDPRGMGRTVRHDGRVDADPVVQAGDVHAVLQAAGGPVDLFASSGGAVTALALVAAHPGDVLTLVAHEPPLIDMLPDADAARRATEDVQAIYAAKGWGHGMAGFMQLTTWQGEYTDEYFAQPAPTRHCSACRPRTTASARTRC